MEDPALAKGLVERDVVRVITAGTVTDPSMLEDRANNYLMSICFQGKAVGVAYADISTGEFNVMEPGKAQLRSEVGRIVPTEIITNDAVALRESLGMEAVNSSEQNASWYQLRNASDALFRHFKVSSLMPLPAP